MNIEIRIHPNAPPPPHHINVRRRSAPTEPRPFATLAELATVLAEVPGLRATLAADGQSVRVEGVGEDIALEEARFEGLDIRVVPDSPELTPAQQKAAHQDALDRRWERYVSPERLATLLKDTVITPRRQSSLEWLRAHRVSEWPPIYVVFNGERALLLGGCHRVVVARELGIRALEARVHVGNRIAYEGLVGV